MGVVTVFLITTLLVSPSVLSASTDECTTKDYGILEGNITLGFMFPFYGTLDGSDVCDRTSLPSENLHNIQLAEAAIYSVQQFQDFIRGVSIGLQLFDSCSSTSNAIKNAVTFLSDRRVYDEDCTGSFKPGFVAHLGGEIGTAIVPLMNDAQSPTTSYAASIANFTHDYSFFTRTVPSDKAEAEAITDMLNSLEWKYVSLLYSNRTEDVSMATTFMNEARRKGICVGEQEMLVGDPSQDNLPNFFSSMAVKSINVVVMFVTQSQADSILEPTFTFHFVLGRRIQSKINQILGRGSILQLSPAILSSDVRREFENYFQSLTLDSYETDADIWFGKYWEERYNCKLDASDSTRCQSSYGNDGDNSFTQNPYVPPVLDAFAAQISTLKRLHEVKCNGAAGMCTEFSSTSPSEISNLLRQTRTNFTTVAFQNVGLRRDGNVADDSFDIFLLEPSQVGFQKIGAWMNGNLDLSSVGNLNVVASVCNSPCSDPNCALETKSVKIPGDIILAGLFSVSDNYNEEIGECGRVSLTGMLHMEAMLYALDRINKETSLLPGITVGMDGFDTCNSPKLASQYALRIVAESNYGNSGSGTRLSSDGETEHFYGIIGPETKDEIQSVISVVKTYDVVTVGFEEQSYSLSSTFSHPGHIRVIPSDTTAFVGLMRLLQNLNLTYVQVVHSADPNSRTYNSILQSYGFSYDICMAAFLEIPGVDATSDDWTKFFEKLQKYPSAKGLVLNAQPEDIKRFLRQLEMAGKVGDYYLVAGEAVPANVDFSDVASAARGLVYITQPPRNYTDFVNYVKALKPGTNVRNPWFDEFWMQRFQCYLPGYSMSYDKQCTGTESLTDSDVTDDRVAYIIDAVYAQAFGLQNMYISLCGGTGGICDDMQRATGTDIFNSISRISFYSVNFDNRLIAFNTIGDAQVQYDIYNIQGSMDVTSVKVAEFRWSLTLMQMILFYDKSGNAVEKDSISTACSVDSASRCLECERQQKDSAAVVDDGDVDVWIAGFFEMTELDPVTGDCTDDVILYNMQQLEAFLFTVDFINNSPVILPNVKLGAIGLNSCNSKGKAERDIQNLLYGSIDYRIRYYSTALAIRGFIGGGTSDTTIAAADKLTPSGISQVSYGATTTLLSDKQKYPYFFRTVPTSNNEVSAVLDMLQLLSHNYVSLVYSDDVYGVSIRDLFVERAANSPDLCLAMTLNASAESTMANIQEIVDRLTSNPQATVVILFTNAQVTNQILRVAEEKGITNIQWISGDAWGIRDSVIYNASITSLGALTLDYPEKDIPGFKEYYTSIRFYSNFRNPWFKPFWSKYFQCNVFGEAQIYDSSCSFFLSLADDYVQSPEATNVYSSVISYALALHTALEENCDVTNHFCDNLFQDKSLLPEALQKVQFQWDDGSTFQFDKNGDGPPQYDVYNIQIVNGRSQYVKVGSWDNGTLNLDGADIQFYDGMQPAQLSPTQCTGRCQECNAPSQFHNDYASLDGEIQLVSLFNVHEKPAGVGDCGMIIPQGAVDVGAFLYAVSMINRIDSVLPGVEVGMKGFDACQTQGRAAHQLVSFLGGYMDLDSSRGWYLVPAIVAPGDPELVTTTSAIAIQYQHPQVLYNVASGVQPMQLTLQINDGVNDLIYLILDTFDWTKVAVLEVKEGGPSALFESFVSMGTARGVCVSVSLSTNQSSLATQIAPVIGQLKSTQVLVLFSSVNTAQAIFNQISVMPLPQVTPIFVLTGAISSVSDISTPPGSLVISSPELPATALQEITQASLQNPWWDEYVSNKYMCNYGKVQSYDNMCDSTVTPGIDFNDISSAQDVIDSVSIIGNALESIRRSKCSGLVSGLCSEFVSTSPVEMMEAISGALRSVKKLWNVQQGNSVKEVGYLEQGVFKINPNDVYLLDESGSPGVVLSTCKDSTSVSQTSVPSRTDQPPQSASLESKLPPFIGPTSVPPMKTSAQRTSVAPSSNTFGVHSTLKQQTTVVQTQSLSQTSSSSQTNQLPQNARLESNLQETWFLVTMILSCIGLIVCIPIAIFFFLNLNEPQFLAASPVLCFTTLLGVALMFAQCVLYGLQVSVTICALRRVLMGVSHACCFLPVFLMCFRLLRILRREKRITGPRTPYVNNKSQFILFILLFLVEAIILFQWLLYENPQLDEGDYDGVMHCKNIDGKFPISLLYIYIAAAIALGIAIFSLLQSTTYFASDIKATIVGLILCLAVAIIWTVIGLNIDTSTYVSYITIMTTLQGYILLTFIFPTKMIAILRDFDVFSESSSVRGDLPPSFTLQPGDIADPPTGDEAARSYNSYKNPMVFETENAM